MSRIEEIKQANREQLGELTKDYKHWDSHDVAYAGFMHRHDEPEWIIFAGKVLLTGILLDMPIDHIVEYIFESFHGLGLGEIPLEWDDLEEDMLDYED